MSTFDIPVVEFKRLISEVNSLTLCVVLTCSLPALTCSLPALAQTPTRVGPQFQINTYTTVEQKVARGAVVAAQDGSFLVVWQNGTSSSLDSEIVGQRFAADGSLLGSELQVSGYTDHGARYPSIAAKPDGSFLVVWESNVSLGTDTSELSVQARLFAADGLPQGQQFQVNTGTIGVQYRARAAIGPGGEFVVVWSSRPDSQTDFSVKGRLFSAAGAPLTNDLQLTVVDNATFPKVTVLPDGDFVVVWTHLGPNGAGTDVDAINGARFDSTGLFVGSAFQVNTYPTNSQFLPSISSSTIGEHVVTWTSDGSAVNDTDGRSIQGRRFAFDGTPYGVDFQVNSYTTSAQQHSYVSVGPNGDFLVVWTGPDEDGTGVKGQRYSAEGQVVGEEFQISTYTTGSVLRPSVEWLSPIELVVVWESLGSPGTDTDGASVQGQRLNVFEEIFADGFESGNISRWSATVP